MHVIISEIITFCVITLCVRKVITICVERLLHFALKILLHFASMLLHFALVLHFAAILITFCVNITFCGDYYILRRNTCCFQIRVLFHYGATNREHLKYLRNVDCVMTNSNHSKRSKQANWLQNHMRFSGYRRFNRGDYEANSRVVHNSNLY